VAQWSLDLIRKTANDAETLSEPSKHKQAQVSITPHRVVYVPPIKIVYEHLISKHK